MTEALKKLAVIAKKRFQIPFQGIVASKIWGSRSHGGIPINKQSLRNININQLITFRVLLNPDKLIEEQTKLHKIEVFL